MLCKIIGHKLDPVALDYGIAHCERCQRELEFYQPSRLEVWRSNIRYWLSEQYEELWRWWRPCPDCKRRFGRHDEAIDHIPF